MKTINDMMFAHRQAEVSEEETLAKSTQYEGAAGVPKSWFTDPFALLDSLGLGFKSSPSGLSYETLRQMSEHSVVVSAIIQTRVHQVASFTTPQRNKYSIGYHIAHKDKNRRLSEGEINFIKDLERFMQRCGYDKNPDRDDLETHTKKIVRDRLMYDQMTTEVVSKYNGKPHSFYVAPAATIRLASPKKRKGTPLKPEEKKKAAKYVQLVDGVLVNSYTHEELAFSIANPRTDLRAWGYGYSELEMLIKTVTSHLWAEEWNRKAFSQGSTTKGILNLKGNIPPQQLDAFKRQWLAQVSGVSNAWRTPVVNSNEEIQWIDLQGTNDEMGYMEWMNYLIKIACACYLIDPAEINFDMRTGARSKPMFMGNNEAQQKMSQDRGLRPLLRHVQNHYNKHIISRIDDDYEFEYVGIDAKTEEQAIELRLKELQSYKTLNEVREAEQLPPVEDGDVVPNPTYIGWRNQKQMMAMQGQQMGAGQGDGQEPGAPGGVPGFDAGGQPPGKEEKDAQASMMGELGEKGPKRKKRKRRADRHRPPPRLEPWESTMVAGVTAGDLRKALSVLDDISQK